jgi:3-hydroxybutyryl-CoA dehydrogenase
LKAVVIGAGVMGSGIAAAVVLGGHDVVLYDEVRDAIERAGKLIPAVVNSLQGESARSKGAVIMADSLEEVVDGVGIVFEAIIEDLNAKRKLYSALSQLITGETIIASNTSTYTVRQLSENLPVKDRILIAHWLNPPYALPLVEVARADWTKDWAVEKTTKFLESIGKEPIQVPDIPGLIVNRFNAAVYREALRLAAGYNVPLETIDLIWKKHLSIVYGVTGVFGTMDYVGIDTIVKASANAPQPTADEDEKAVNLIMGKLQQGELGVKTNRGFYIYKSRDRLSLELQRAEAIRGVLRCLEEVS